MIHDFRFAFRQLWKSPAFTIAAVAVLALGIGVNTAIFSLVNALLFAPPPYKDPAEIVQLFSQDKKAPKSFRAFSYPTFRDVRDQNTVFAGVMAHSETVVGLGEKGNIRRAASRSRQLELLFGPRRFAAYGRSFLPEEEKPGSAQRVAIVSHQLLEEIFARPVAPRSHASNQWPRFHRRRNHAGRSYRDGKHLLRGSLAAARSFRRDHERCREHNASNRR